MDDVVEFRTADGAVVMVQGNGTRTGAPGDTPDDGAPAPGFLVGDDTPTRATRTFEGALDGVRAAAESALRAFRDGSLRPDSVELEFGVTLSAEVGAVIAKGSGEGHLVVRLSWSPTAQAEVRGERAEACPVTTPVAAAPVAHHAPQPVPQRPPLPPQPTRLPGSAPLSQPVAVVVVPPGAADAGAGAGAGAGAVQEAGAQAEG